MRDLVTNPEDVSRDLRKMSNSDLLKLLDDEGLRESSDELHKVDESPVDINAFLDEGKYLGNYFDGQFLSDRSNYWRMFLNEIYRDVYDSPYWLCCMKGAIGVGKTTTACAGMAYDAYRLLCLGDPQRTLGVIPTDKIEFAIFNVTLTLAINVVWDKISQMFTSSEYFNNLLGTTRRKHREDSLFPKRIDFYSGSRVGHSLGHSVYEVVIDEANFEILTGQVRKNFYSLLRRMETRYMTLGGGFPGKIWIISSETDKSSVLNQIIEEYRGKKGVIVRQPSLWEVKPERYDKNKKWFRVFKGTELRSPVIIDSTNEKEYKNEEENIILVPEEHRSSFEAAIHESLRDLAGISTGSSYKLFRMKEKLNLAMCVDLLFPEVFELDFHDDTDQISNKVLIPEYFKRLFSPEYPRYLHIDIGLTGDRLGIGCTYVSQYRERTRISITDLKKITEMVPELVTEFAFGIQSKDGHPIPLFKVRAFILWLSSLGYTFGMISADGYECFTGDTKISLLNGSEVEIKDLVGEDEFWVYSCTPDGSIVPGRGHSARKIGIRPVVKITLDNGETIKCTADHRFMMRDGSYKEAQFLTPDDSLMPLYRKVEQSYERFWDNRTNKWNVTHIRVAKEIYPDYKPSKYKDPNGYDEKYINRRVGELTQEKYNHKIVKIEDAGHEDVYDISVDNYNNFALTSGVFVHNSADLLMMMHKLGFATEELSVDKTSLPYLKLRTNVYEELVYLPASKMLRKELDNLESTPDGSKVDHPEKFPDGTRGCLSGETKIALLDGTNPTIKELADSYTGEPIYLYTIRNGEVGVGIGRNPRLTKLQSNTVEIILDNGEKIVCTPDHRILLRNNSYVEAQNLKVGDSLMSLYRKVSTKKESNLSGYEMFKRIRGIGCSETLYRNKVREYELSGSNIRNNLKVVNHKVVSVIPGLLTDVYDITVEETENFSLSSGVFVHNSKDIADGVCGSQTSALRNSDKYKMVYFHPAERGAVGGQMRDMFWPGGKDTGTTL